MYRSQLDYAANPSILERKQTLFWLERVGRNVGKGEVGFRSAGSGSEEEIRQLWNEQDKQMSIKTH